MEMEKWISKLTDTVVPLAVSIGTKVIGALILWIIGRMVINGMLSLLRKGGERRKVDPTLIRYLNSAVGAALQILLVIAVLGVFGIETTTFASLLAAGGIAIGMAWSGLLSNFAAGVFMVILRPFKVGDMITVAGLTGTVQEVGLFVTSLDTPDNIRTFIGNSKIFSEVIQNHSANSYKRVDLTAQLAHSVDPVDAIARLRRRLAQIPNVARNPAPQVEILSFNRAGAVLAVRPFCHNDHYWDVYFAANQAIRDEFTQASYPVAEEHMVLRNAT